jgi:hypothetical protein
MTEWISASEVLPPQGTKVVCFHKGDIYVAYRIRDIWLPLPYCPRLIKIAPELWQKLTPPAGYKGKILFKLMDDDEFYDLEGLEKKDPDDYEVLYGELKKKRDDIDDGARHFSSRFGYPR